MATNTLIQKLFGADESGVGEDSNLVSNRIVTEKFRASEAISAGACVSLDVSAASNGERSMIVALADASDYVPVGIAATAASASGEYIDVILLVSLKRHLLMVQELLSVQVTDWQFLPPVNLSRPLSSELTLVMVQELLQELLHLLILLLLSLWKLRLLTQHHECLYSKTFNCKSLTTISNKGAGSPAPVFQARK